MLSAVHLAATTSARRLKVGAVTLTERDSGKAVRAVVTREDDAHFLKDPAVAYRVLARGQEVGYMFLDKARMAWPDSARQVFISYMNAEQGNQRYHGIGTSLHQIAIEDSLRRLGHVHTLLDSEPRAVMFHFRCGYRLVGMQTQDQHERALAAYYMELEDAEGNHRFPNRMYLSPQAVDDWQARIHQRPVLTPSRK